MRVNLSDLGGPLRFREEAGAEASWSKGGGMEYGLTQTAGRAAGSTRLLVTSILLGLMLAGCGRLSPPRIPPASLTPGPLDVTITIGTTLPTTTPFECTDIPGLSLSASVLRSGLVEIRGEGFLPGEDTTLVAKARVRRGNSVHAQTHEVHPAAEVGADGRFRLGQGLTPIEGLATTWHIAIIHSRGVACTMVVVR